MIEYIDIAEGERRHNAINYKYRRVKGEMPRRTNHQPPTHPLSQLTGTAKVDDLYSGPLGITQQDVLRLQITVDDIQFWKEEEEQQRITRLPMG